MNRQAKPPDSVENDPTWTWAGAASTLCNEAQAPTPEIAVTPPSIRKSAMLQYALSAGLVGMLAIGAGGGWPGPVRPGAEATSQVSQYCVPPEQDPNSPRLYCRNGEG
jgi:hypothetical protein